MWKPVKKGHLIVSLTGAGLVLIAWLAWIFSGNPSERPDPLTSESQAVYGCLERADVRCISELLTDEELLRYGLSREQAAKLLIDYVVPTYAQQRRVGEDVVIPSKLSGACLRMRKLKNNAAYMTTLTSEVYMTPDGNRSPELLGMTVLWAMGAKHGRAGTTDTAALVEAIDRDSEKLSRLGMKGAYDSRLKRVIPWPELKNTFIRIEDAERRANAKASEAGTL